MLAAEPDTPSRPRPRSRSSAIVAALASLSLGLLAAAMMVGGHQPWDGPELVGLTATHGIHEGDVWAVVPLVVGAVLARWCWSQR